MPNEFVIRPADIYSIYLNFFLIFFLIYRVEYAGSPCDLTRSCNMFCADVLLIIEDLEGGHLTCRAVLYLGKYGIESILDML